MYGQVMWWVLQVFHELHKTNKWIEDETAELADGRTILCVLVTKGSWRGVSQYCLKFSIM